MSGDSGDSAYFWGPRTLLGSPHVTLCRYLHFPMFGCGYVPLGKVVWGSVELVWPAGPITLLLLHGGAASSRQCKRHTLLTPDESTPHTSLKHWPLMPGPRND